VELSHELFARIEIFPEDKERENTEPLWSANTKLSKLQEPYAIFSVNGNFCDGIILKCWRLAIVVKFNRPSRRVRFARRDPSLH
jgi:hypothetical protein